MADLRAGLAAQYRTAENRSDAENLIKRAVDFGLLGRRVPEGDVADFMGHYTGHFALVSRGFDHSAINEHRPARQRESVNIAGVHNLKSIIKRGLLELRRNCGNQPISNTLNIVLRLAVV